MTYKHKNFKARATCATGPLSPSYEAEVVHAITNERSEDCMMVITPIGPIYITKRQAMEFFNLRSNE